MEKVFKPTRKTILLALALLACVVALLVMVFIPNNNKDENKDTKTSQIIQERKKMRGTTDVVTVPIYAPGQARGFVPRPDDEGLPPLFDLQGNCEEAAEPVREFMDANPYGALLEEKLANNFSQLYNKFQASTDCDQDAKQGFTQQEVDVWLTWVQPGS